MEENKEEMIENNGEEIALANNDIKIAEGVVASIAGVAVSEVSGVFGMAGGFVTGKKNIAKGIKVELEGQQAKIDVNIIVEFGARIPDVAYEIQKRVTKSVEEMTGLKVSSVGVHVQDVKMQGQEENVGTDVEKK